MAKNNIPGTEPVPAGQGLKKFDMSAFLGLQGERFEGLNVLKLKAGEAVGDLVVTKIGVQKVNGRGKEKNKVREIPSYSAKGGDGKEYKLPLNASLVSKLVDAKVKVGDTIAIARGEEYTSKAGNKGSSFDLIVQKRK